jgi:hypothetical protein
MFENRATMPIFEMSSKTNFCETPVSNLGLQKINGTLFRLGFDVGIFLFNRFQTMFF